MKRTLLAAAIAGSVVTATPARAADVRFASDEARVTVNEAGVARVEHALKYRVIGPLPRSVELTGVEPEALVDPVVPTLLDGAPASDAHLERKGDRAVRVTFDPAPARRGAVRSSVLSVRVAYTVDLVKAGELTPSGAMWRLRWTAPAAPEGYDSARTTFDLPAAPTEPRLVADEGAAEDDGRTTTLKRGPERDELAIERPHVAKGEPATWSARVDPRAFPRVVDPTLRPSPAASPQPESPTRTRGWLVAALVGILFGALVRAKHAAFARACKESGVAPAGLVGFMPGALGAWLAGAALGAAVVAQASSMPVLGALGVVVAMVLAVSRATRPAPAPRGPGQWLALSADEAFARGPDAGVLGCADAATDAGKWVLVGVALAAVGTGVALALGSTQIVWAWLVPLDALALLPVLITGSRAQLPPDRVAAPKERLAALHRSLKRDAALRVAPWARVPTGASVPDELRLLVVPRAPIPGVVGIEVGVAWTATPAGYAPEPEVLVRVREATAAAARMVALAPGRRAVHGRKTDERVVRLVPTLPSRAGTIALVKRLASELRDRRKSLPGPVWSGAERRLPPNERLRVAA
jgi:hypothetical protein